MRPFSPGNDAAAGWLAATARMVAMAAPADARRLYGEDIAAPFELGAGRSADFGPRHRAERGRHVGGCPSAQAQRAAIAAPAVAPGSGLVIGAQREPVGAHGVAAAHQIGGEAGVLDREPSLAQAHRVRPPVALVVLAVEGVRREVGLPRDAGLPGPVD